ncbi:SPT2 chromatin protein [Striga asiatica]|uniref:SPT2 chromatin protein n=1 Tax=Striga asiatica TaxID=4170 RepID=A0A5A7P816_STRAF|nr:SPT2 chromatin protein [Striga asiatica]
MGDYERDEYEDWDEYEEDGDERVQEEVGEDEYEEETYQPTQEELDYLELRQKLKESIRNQMKKELGTADAGSRNRINGFSKDNYGTFFGPRYPSISQRVIQESKSLLENPDLAAKIMKSNRAVMQNKSSVAKSVSSKSRDNHLPRVTNGLKKKVEILKNTRDYSFLLSEDSEIPAASKSLPPKTVSAPKTGVQQLLYTLWDFGALEDARSAQQQPNRSNKQVANERGREPTSNDRNVRRPMPSSIQNKPKVVQEKTKIPIKPAMDPRKQLGSNNGSGPGRPVGPKSMSSSSAPISTSKATPATAKYTMAGGVRRPAPSSVQSAIRKPMPSNMQSGIHKLAPPRAQPSSVVKKPSVQQKESLGSSKPKVITKQAVSSSSRDQLRRPPPKAPASHRLADERPKAKHKRPLDDEVDDPSAISSMIRSMFRYNPNNFSDDDDDRDMEANFEDIVREEKRSAKIGREEDERELRLEEEERRRRLAKKRKLGH